jgi:hypothetical protein
VTRESVHALSATNIGIDVLATTISLIWLRNLLSLYKN